MEQFIRYLYEYQQGKPSRNVGFVKVERSEEQTTVHIHGKGLQLGRETELKLYIFFEEKESLTGIFQGLITNINPSVNYRLVFGREDAGKPENYLKIQGIVMRAESGRHFAAVWSDHPVHVEQMREWEEPERIPLTMTEAVRQRVAEDIAGHGSREAREDTLEQKDSAEQETAAGAGNPEGREEAAAEGKPGGCEGAGAEGNPGESRAAAGAEPDETGTLGGFLDDEEAPGNAEHGNRNKSVGNRRADAPQEKEAAEEIDVYITPGKRQCKKISRQDIAMLPRCEWRLANNSFLLHGCYNYHYLMLVEEGDELWLGVPGLYHSREAKAAEAFGFPRFIPLGELSAEMEEEDGDSGEKFGYWCRRVRRMNQFSL